MIYRGSFKLHKFHTAFFHMRWHLGFCNDSYLPLSRGFDTFNGYLGGSANYYTHSGYQVKKAPKHFTGGYDYRKNNEIDIDAKGIYQAQLMSTHAIQIINSVDFFEKKHEKGIHLFYLIS